MESEEYAESDSRGYPQPEIYFAKNVPQEWRRIATPVWFGEEGDRLYVMTRSDMGKVKRIRNNPKVQVAPCTIRGKITGAEFAATARVLPLEEHAHARQTINRKYLLARISSPWSKADAFLELTFG